MAPHLRDLSSLVSSMASGLPRGWLPTVARRAASVSRAALHPPVRRVSRFPCGSRNMASGSAVKSEQLGKPDKHRLTLSPDDPIHTTKGIINSMDKHFPITRGMENEENGPATEEFIARYGDGRPANVEEDESKIVDAMYSDEDFSRTTVEVAGVKQDPRGAVQELTDGEEDARNLSASEVSDDDDDEYEEFSDRVDN